MHGRSALQGYELRPGSSTSLQGQAFKPLDALHDIGRQVCFTQKSKQRWVCVMMVSRCIACYSIILFLHPEYCALHPDSCLWILQHQHLWLLAFSSYTQHSSRKKQQTDKSASKPFDPRHFLRPSLAADVFLRHKLFFFFLYSFNNNYYLLPSHSARCSVEKAIAT